MSSELDRRRLDSFARRLASHPRRRVGRQALWAAFAAAFPGRPQGAEERRWFLAALKELSARGLVRLPSPRGKRWDSTLGVAAPASVDLLRKEPVARDRDWRTFPWHPRLQWIADLRNVTPHQERFLRRVHEGLVDEWFSRPAPLKYRSLQLTDDEKKLGSLRRTQLFGPGRLDLELLGCLPEVLPLAWESTSRANSSIIVFENAGPFVVARGVLSGVPDPAYGMVAYGGGARVEAAIPHLLTIGRSVEQIHYVGDIDRNGLRIALAAADAARQCGLPPVEPAPGLHRAMLEARVRFDSPQGWPHHTAGGSAKDDDTDLVAFLPEDVRSEALAVLRAGCRIPEEVLGPDELGAVWSAR